MFFARYRFALIWAIPVGAMIGTTLGLLLYLLGNPDFRNFGGWSAFAQSVGAGAGVGIVTAAAGLVGGVLTALITDRSRPEPRVWVSGTCYGAAVGVFLLFLTVGIVSDINNRAMGSEFMLFGTVGFFVAVVSGWAAIPLLHGTRNRFEAETLRTERPDRART